MSNLLFHQMSGAEFSGDQCRQAALAQYGLQVSAGEVILMATENVPSTLRTSEIAYLWRFLGSRNIFFKYTLIVNSGSIIGISSISALQGGGFQTHVRLPVLCSSKQSAQYHPPGHVGIRNTDSWMFQYTPTKAGVLSLMQSMAIALGKENIRCNAILPGTIRTQLSEEEMGNDVTMNALVKKIPMGRVGETSDIAGPAVFLGCEQLSPFCNGSQLLADGKCCPLSSQITSSYLHLLQFLEDKKTKTPGICQEGFC